MRVHEGDTWNFRPMVRPASRVDRMDQADASRTVPWSSRRLFPPWFERFARWTPFPSMVNAVVEIYMGVLTGPEIARTLLIQVMWALLLFAASQVVLRAGVRRLVIQGG